LTNENGRWAEGNRFGTHVTRYDERGYKTEEVYYSDRLIHRREIYSRDVQGNYVEKIYDAEPRKPADVGPPKQGQDSPLPKVLTCSVKRDTDGNPIEKTCYAKDGKSATRTVYNFDPQKNAREITEYDDDSTVHSKCTEEYGSDGQVISRSCRYFSKAIADLVRQTFTYEFDSSGNWVKRIGSAWQTKDGQTVFIGKDVVSRTISYDASKDVRPDDGSKLVDPLPPGPLVIRKSGGVFQESATKRVKPVYPNEALVAGVTGDIVVEVKVDERGKVESAEAISGPPELRQTAVEAAKQWEFKPTSLSGTAVKVIGRLTFNFRR
jgi:TonB family protein